MKPLNPEISYFARVDFRDQDQLFGIYQSDRLYSMYLLGKTGSGKTNTIESLAFSDITAGSKRGIAVLDVVGDLSHKLIAKIPEHQKERLIYIDLTDPNLVWGYNPLKKVSQDKRHLIVSFILETFQKQWSAQSWGARLEYTLRNILTTLLDQPKSDFSDITRMLTDTEYRDSCVSKVRSKHVKAFWKEEFPKYSRGDILPILNKVGSFLTIPVIERFMTEKRKQLSLSRAMNEGKILIVNLGKGSVGSDAANLLGSLLLNGIAAAGFTRVSIPEAKRKPFFVYADEAHNITTLTLCTMLSELRKMGVGLVLGHQFLNQLSPKIQDAILGNVGTIICFRLSYSDARYMAQEFFPVFKPIDFIELNNYSIYLRMIIKGTISPAFSAVTIHSAWVDPTNLPHVSKFEEM